MFRNTFQSGFLSILYSIGSKPLQIWDKEGVTHALHDVFQPNFSSNIILRFSDDARGTLLVVEMAESQLVTLPLRQGC
jgi:hypothetical protein